MHLVQDERSICLHYAMRSCSASDVLKDCYIVQFAVGRYLGGGQLRRREQNAHFFLQVELPEDSAPTCLLVALQWKAKVLCHDPRMLQKTKTQSQMILSMSVVTTRTTREHGVRLMCF